MPKDTVLSHPEIPVQAVFDGTAISDASAEQEIDVVNVLILLLRGKKIILNFVLAGAAIAALLAYVVLRPMYTAQAVFLPPQTAPGSGISQLASQMGSLGALGALSGLKSPSDIYLGILESRTVADDIIHKFDLQKVYGTGRLSDTVKKLKKRSNFASGKNTLITIDVEDHDPARATAMADAYLDALQGQNGKLALTESSQRRLFFEQQLEREKNALADAEVQLKKTEEQTGLIAPVGQAQVQIDSIAQVRAQISSREVQLKAMEQSATNQNPEVVRLQAQIVGLEQQLQKMESDSGVRRAGNVLPSASTVPELALEYVRKQREVKYHETLFELIARQYEMARLDESREAPVLQVVDRAVVPDKRSGPPRTLILLAGCLLGALAGIAWLLLRAFFETLRQDPVRSMKFDGLLTAMSLRH